MIILGAVQVFNSPLSAMEEDREGANGALSLSPREGAQSTKRRADSERKKSPRAAKKRKVEFSVLEASPHEGEVKKYEQEEILTNFTYQVGELGLRQAPAEIWASIFQHCTKKEVDAFSQTCQYARFMAPLWVTPQKKFQYQKDESFMPRKNIWDPVPMSLIEDIASSYYGGLSTLILKASLELNDFKKIIDLLPNLRCLKADIKKKDTETFASLSSLENRTNLTDLTLAGRLGVPAIESLSCFENLTSLSIRDQILPGRKGFITPDFSLFPYLKHLKVYFLSRPYTDKDFFSFNKECNLPALTSLNMGMCKFSKVPGFPNGNLTAPNLTTLNLTLCQGSRLNLERFSQFPHLRILNLSWTKLTSWELDFLPILKELRELNLVGNHLAPADLHPLCNLPALNFLDCRENRKQVNKSFLEELEDFPFLPSLTHLKISYPETKKEKSKLKKFKKSYPSLNVTHL
jgi:hypothetical protein